MIIEFLASQSLLFWAISSAVFISFLIQLYHYFFVFGKIRIGNIKKLLKKAVETEEPVSVILCIQNETTNLEEILPLLLEQNYPKYEVIVINDKSADFDASDDILNFAKLKYPHLEIRNLNTASSFVHGKSVVMGVGIKAAKYDKIVLTDPNCRPSLNWLKSIASAPNSDIILSYTRYSANKFLGVTNFYESMFQIGFALNKQPYTGSGNNSAFNKNIFFDKRFNPFLQNIDKIEQVFFNAVANGKNTSAVLYNDAINDSVINHSFNEWCSERAKEIYSRRLFCRKKYIKTPELISRIVFYFGIAAFIALYFNVLWIVIFAGSLFFLRLLIQIIIFSNAQKALKEKDLLIPTLCWDFLSIFVSAYLYWFCKHKIIRRLKR